jgi:hypothetical protein
VKSKAQEYWEKAKEAEEKADRAGCFDVQAARTWHEVAAQWREMALQAERNRW